MTVFPHSTHIPATDPIGHPNCTGDGNAHQLRVGARMAKAYGALFLQGDEASGPTPPTASVVRSTTSRSGSTEPM